MKPALHERKQLPMAASSWCTAAACSGACCARRVSVHKQQHASPVLTCGTLAHPPARSQEELGSPALAFVRTACHLLALDTAVTDEVALLRRRLLKLLAVGEFGSAAQFREPCMSFRLPDVICGCVVDTHAPHACQLNACMRHAVCMGPMQLACGVTAACAHGHAYSPW